MRWIFHKIEIFACGKSTGEHTIKQCNKLRRGRILERCWWLLSGRSNPNYRTKDTFSAVVCQLGSTVPYLTTD